MTQMFTLGVVLWSGYGAIALAGSARSMAGAAARLGLVAAFQIWVLRCAGFMAL